MERRVERQGRGKQWNCFCWVSVGMVGRHLPNTAVKYYHGGFDHRLEFFRTSFLQVGAEILTPLTTVEGPFGFFRS